MAARPIDLEIRRIVTDSDLDGVVTGAILRRWWTDAEVFFGHPGQLRAGIYDDLIDRNTAICDLPAHPNCGLSIDHHQSNKSSLSSDGAVVIWKDSPSAARIAFELFSENIDLSDMEELIEWVDKLDSGGITREEYLSDSPVLWLSRLIDEREDVANIILENLQMGVSVEDILEQPNFNSLVNKKRVRMEELKRKIEERLRIEDRLAIVRLENLGLRSNGYQITAMGGERCDACIVIHGDIGASFDDNGKYPVSASFYTNSFLHRSGGIFDLTLMATLLDPDGGGHANACGCRIKPIGEHGIENRQVSGDDIQRNIELWQKMWSKR